MNDIISVEHVNKRVGETSDFERCITGRQRGDIFGYLARTAPERRPPSASCWDWWPRTPVKLPCSARMSRLIKPVRKSGFVLEADGTLWINLTAYDNLLFYANFTIFQNRRKKWIKYEASGTGRPGKDKVSTYSKGMRQRLALARAIAPDPEVADTGRTTAGVDPDRSRSKSASWCWIWSTKKAKLYCWVRITWTSAAYLQPYCPDPSGQIRLYGGLEQFKREYGTRRVSHRDRGKIPADT